MESTKAVSSKIRTRERKKHARVEGGKTGRYIVVERAERISGSLERAGEREKERSKKGCMAKPRCSLSLFVYTRGICFVALDSFFHGLYALTFLSLSLSLHPFFRLLRLFECNTAEFTCTRIYIYIYLYSS